jgi:hypothetical protein
MLRRLPIVAAACAIAGLFAGQALGAPVRPATLHTLASQGGHFLVHYDTDPSFADHITETEAGDLAAIAERAYATETGWGFQPPVDDGDGRIDVYVVDLSSAPGVIGEADPDAGTAPTSGMIEIAQSVIGTDEELHAVAHELFHLIQFRTWVPQQYTDGWLLEGAAEWAGYKADGYANVAGSTGPIDMALDCRDLASSLYMCDAQDYANFGYSRWTFFELLAQKFGPTFVDAVEAQAQAQGSALAGLQAALAAKGAGLADTFTDFAVRELAHGWGISALDSDPVPVTVGPVSTGASGGAIPTTTVAVNHLAARIVSFARGDGHGEHACFKATLTLNVAVPAGTGSRPFWRWSGDAAPAPLAVSGSTATITVPWDTCTWSSGAGYLVLPNASTTVDAADFTVSGTLSVDQTAPATPGADPTPATLTGPIVAVPTAAVPPTIDVLSPLLLHVSAAAPTLRLIVSSSNDGAVHVTLGSADLGSPAVRMGNNDLRFALPKSLLSALRRSTAAGNVLTVTPVASTGAATGRPVTRSVAVTPAPKARPTPKPKPKRGAKK